MLAPGLDSPGLCAGRLPAITLAKLTEEKMEFLALLYILVYIISGFLVARRVLPEGGVGGTALGLAAGLAMLMWLPALFSFVLGFTVLSQLLAVALCALIGLFAALFRRTRTRLSRPGRFKPDWRAVTVCAPLVLLIWVLMFNHIITPASDGSLHSGQSTFGDMCMHLGFITSISVQQTFPPEYSIMPGADVGYPFLCDSVSSTFYTLGCSLRFSALLPMFYAAAAVVVGVYWLFETWLGRGKASVLATYLFFIGGGFGFAYLFDLWKVNGAENWSGLMHGFYETPTNQTSLGLRWVNPIADMLVPQRATLFGWALLFPALALLYRASIGRETRLFLPLGALAGCMPLVHTHSFLALGVISLFLLCAEYARQFRRPEPGWRRRLLSFAGYGLLAVIIAAPQLVAFTFRQAGSGGFLRLHWNWANELYSWLWFYIKNLGLIFILLLPAFICARRESKLFYGGALLLWAISEFVVFQPNTYDNNKLLFVWFALSCGLVSEYACGIWDRLSSGADKPRRLSNAALAFICAFAVFTSGALTLAREYVSGDHLGLSGFVESGYQVVGAEQVELAEYINTNTPADAVFMTATNHNNAVAMLTGRSIVCGSPSFLYYHGLDYSTRELDLTLAYEQPEANFKRVSAAYSVDYVLISSYERGSYDIDEEWFAANLECVFENPECRLYAVK